MTTQIVPAPVSLSNNDLMAELKRLQAENLALKASKSGPFPMKVGDKGGLVVILGGAFPTTLYAEQWERILDNGESIRTFIKAHPELKRK